MSEKIRVQCIRSMPNNNNNNDNSKSLISNKDYLKPKEEKPAYFNLFEDLEVPSEDDLVVGEDNYIEIKGVEQNQPKE